MLLPRFSTRVILLVMAVCAVYSLMVGLAIRGSVWAAGAAVAATSLVFVALVHAALFGLCYVVARLFPRDSPRSRVSLWLIVAALLALPLPSSADTGTVVTLPPPKAKPVGGLRITVNSTWVENFGYRPIHVTVTSTKPATADQTITFRYKASHWQFGQRPLIEVDQDIELHEGDTSVSATVLVPKLQDWQTVWWDVLVDGSFEKGLSLDRNTSGWFNQVGNLSGDNLPRVLLVVGEGKQASMPASVVSANNYSMGYGGYGGPVMITSPVDQSVNTTTAGTMSIAGTHFAAQRTVTDLPTQWLGYTSLDQLVLTADQLAQIQSENPEAWVAIARWVRSGGNLWLCDLGNGWDKLPAALERLGPLVEANEEGDVLWYTPFAAQNVSVSSAFLREATAQERGGEPPSGGTAFAWRPASLGALLISQPPFDQLSGQEWTWLQEQDGQNLGWTARHGTSPNLPNESFANLLIPGVGLAPVTEFRILITLFVLLIGPVNYWFLRRYKRLHLLILSVPLAALVVTLALFAYAVVGDGLSTRLRVRSVTTLDQQAGEALSWARLSYYAGLAPSGGLEFPTDAAVYPINPGWTEMSNFGGEVQLTPRALQWADKQYLTEGWLASRTPTQYLTVAARRSDRKLEIAPQGDDVRVTNQLGAAIELLLLRDKDGRLFTGASLAPDASLVLTEVDDESELAGRLRILFQDREPTFPDGFDDQRTGMVGRPYQYNYNSYNPYGYGGPSSASRLEQRIDSFTQPVGAGSSRSINLPSGTYLALVRRGVEVTTGLADQDEEGSFHVVHGTW